MSFEKTNAKAFEQKAAKDAKIRQRIAANYPACLDFPSLPLFASVESVFAFFVIFAAFCLINSQP
jgi:hypothetical protein